MASTAVHIDNSLVRDAQRLAGGHIHEVNKFVHLYTNHANSRGSRLRKIALENEARLRAFVTLRRIG